MKISYSDLEDAYLWTAIDIDPGGAYINTETGAIIMISEYQPEIGDEVPEDIEADYWLAVPGKVALDLGHRVLWDFLVDKPEPLQAEADRIIGRKGMYRKCKALFARYGLLDAWYAFENARREAALIAWATRHGLEVTR